MPRESPDEAYLIVSPDCEARSLIDLGVEDRATAMPPTASTTRVQRTATSRDQSKSTVPALPGRSTAATPSTTERSRIVKRDPLRAPVEYIAPDHCR